MTTEEFKLQVLPVKDRLFRLAGRILNDMEDARDIVQEVLLRLWTKQDEIVKYRNVEAFAVVMTRNLCLDKIKSKGYGHDQLKDWNAPADEKSPEKLAELKDTVSQVHQIIARLPEQQKLVVQMRDIEEMEYDDIALQLSMNVNAVRVTLSRARKEIRDQLTKKHEYEYK